VRLVVRASGPREGRYLWLQWENHKGTERGQPEKEIFSL
jgi:hypothetical protein